MTLVRPDDPLRSTVSARPLHHAPHGSPPRFTGEDKESDAMRDAVSLSARLHAGAGEQLHSSRHIASAST
jgi:hypothetical protein